MPTYLKFAVSFCAEVSVIVLGGVAGVWLAVRDIPAGGGGRRTVSPWSCSAKLA